MSALQVVEMPERLRAWGAVAPRWVGRAELVHVELVTEACARYFGVNETILFSRRRTVQVSHARQTCMAILRMTTRLALMDIGEIFDRDHATVIHAVSQTRKHCKLSRRLTAFVGSFGEPIVKKS